MKNRLTVALLLICSIASAQIVNIPDPVFKNWLITNPAINANGDNEIQQSEALTVDNLNIYGADVIGTITDFTGLNSFTNLTWFEIFDFNAITTIDFSGMTALNYISVHTATGLRSINTNGCTNLQRMRFENTNFSSLDVSQLQNLTDLQLYFDPAITELNAGNLPNLTSINLQNPHIGYVNLKNCNQLNSIQADAAVLGKIDLSGCTALLTLQLTSWSIDTLLLTNCSNLTTIRGNMSGTINKMTDFTGCTNLNSINLEGFNLREVDLSTCINLQELHWPRSTINFSTINIKNGSSLTLLDIPQHGNDDTLYICTDDFETAAVTAALSNFINGGAVVNVNSYCSFNGGGNYNTINGKVKLDMNNNGCDVSDAGMGYVPVSFSNSITGEVFTNYTYENGNYSFYTYNGNFTVSPSFPNPYFSLSPATANVVFPAANNLTDTKNFCIAPNGNHNDLEISFLPGPMPARPGFQAGYWILYKNKGTTTASGNIQLNFNNTKMTFNMASLSTSSQNAAQLTWNYTNLQPFQSGAILVTFDILPPPVNNVNDTISFSGSINPVSADETPGNNNFAIVQPVTGSWDPNDIQCLEGAKINLASLTKPLHYVIRFQNTGTDTAFNAVVADVLSDKYDWSSFEFTGSSHPCAVKQKGNKLEFIFQNIKLPHEAIDPDGSHGYVAFRIKPKSNLIIGDSLNNEAAIYFDFNLPVITNKVVTVVSPISTLATKIESFSLKCTEQENILTWKAAAEGDLVFDVERSADGIHFNSINTLAETEEQCRLPINFTDNKPLNAFNYYRIRMTDAHAAIYYSKILLAQKIKQGLEINAIVNNQAYATIYLNSPRRQSILIKMTSADGKIIFKQNKNITAGFNQVNLSLNNIAHGVINVQVYASDGQIITKRFLK